MKNKFINFDTECWICGKPESFNVCVDCGTKLIIEVDNGKTGTNKIIQYLKDTNVERFNQMIEQFKNSKNN